MKLKLLVIKYYLLRHDLLKHFFIGFFIFVIANQFTSNAMALIATTIVATAKELIYDLYFKKGTPEFIDVVYTILPAVVLIAFK